MGRRAGISIEGPRRRDRRVTPMLLAQRQRQFGGLGISALGVSFAALSIFSGSSAGRADRAPDRRCRRSRRADQRSDRRRRLSKSKRLCRAIRRQGTGRYAAFDHRRSARSHEEPAIAQPARSLSAHSLGAGRKYPSADARHAGGSGTEHAHRRAEYRGDDRLSAGAIRAHRSVERLVERDLSVRPIRQAHSTTSSSGRRKRRCTNSPFPIFRRALGLAMLISAAFSTLNAVSATD